MSVHFDVFLWSLQIHIVMKLQWDCGFDRFWTVFDQFLISFGLWEVYIAPRGTPDLVEELQNPQKWTALVAYVILDTKFFIQLQKLRKLWTNRKNVF